MRGLRPPLLGLNRRTMPPHIGTLALNSGEQSAHTLAGRALDAEGKHACCLLVDPTPGTLVVFPSFVPHFVLPTPVATEPCTARPLRLSIAMNFGACDPVLAHVLVVPSRTGTPRVKLALEVDDAFR